MAKSVRVTSAHVKAAKTLVELARQRGEDVSPSILKIANAKRRTAEPKHDMDTKMASTARKAAPRKTTAEGPARRRAATEPPAPRKAV